MLGRRRGGRPEGIRIKTPDQLAIMRDAGRILARTLEDVGRHVEPGVSTLELDQVAAGALSTVGARASFLGLYGFPASLCASVNDTVVHGIPSDQVVLEEGDIVGVDIGVYWMGFHVDGAATFAAGVVSRRVRKLMEATEKSLKLGIEATVVGKRVSAVSRAIQDYIEAKCGYHCVRALCGHGVGFEVHEDPQMPNYVSSDPGPELLAGMTLAIEPMVNMGTADVYTDDDGWAVRTADGRASAHFEHTVAVTDDGPVVLTAL